MKIQELDNLIPEEVCEKIINTFKDLVIPAEIINDQGMSKKSEIRVASNYFFDSNQFPDMSPGRHLSPKETN